MPAPARQLAVTYRRVEELLPYASNARTHSKAQIQSIANSMKAFGWTNPILIDETGGIVAGHGRLAAAQQLKLKRIPCIELTGLTPEQRQAYVIADNQLATHAGWDLQILATELKGLEGSGFNLDLLGFSKLDLKNLIGADAPVRTGKTPDDAPPPGGPLVSRQGDVWSCGRHLVMCGDSTSASDIDQLVQSDIIDICWTDPPYNVDYASNAGSIQNDNLQAAAFAALLDQAFRHAYRSLRPGAVIYVAHYFCGDFTKTTVIDDDLDLKKMPRKDLEALVEQLRAAVPSTVVRQDRPTKSEMHPTMKPVALVQQLLANSAIEGQTVYDPFAGSGTTMIAAEKLGLQSRLMELEERFADVCVRRWEAFTGKTATHVGSGQSFAEIQAERNPVDKGVGAEA